MAKTKRLRFPADEARLPWLALLLQAYAVADEGVSLGIRREQQQGRKLACARGCANCCRSHVTIPVYPLELLGLYWHVSEKISEPIRGRLQAQLQAYQAGQPCPFLLDEACSVHPLRPLACRHFNVFGRACGPGEDAYYTRRVDVLTPLREYQEQALQAMLPFHGISDPARQREFVQSGKVHQLAQVLQDLPWAKLAQRMAQADIAARE